ncbi:MAG: hypothetical protein B7X09_00150 [Acidiphilium sp. 21-66-27]|nr:MAG: hypothetical protein B7Z76_13340 [Acidiphilium sp. 20-67-58]OYV67814.1 MAG: hypothetical protein B7X09_00150 [Acidiphilium sp. 21-66-27]
MKSLSDHPRRLGKPARIERRSSITPATLRCLSDGGRGAARLRRYSGVDWRPSTKSRWRGAETDGCPVVTATDVGRTVPAFKPAPGSDNSDQDRSRWRRAYGGAD